MILRGLNKWGKERVKRHGPEFALMHRGHFRGQPAVLVRSLRSTYADGSHWIGWFILDVDAAVADSL